MRHGCIFHHVYSNDNLLMLCARQSSRLCGKGTSGVISLVGVDVVVADAAAVGRSPVSGEPSAQSTVVTPRDPMMMLNIAACARVPAPATRRASLSGSRARSGRFTARAQAPGKAAFGECQVEEAMQLCSSVVSGACPS